LHSLLDDRCNSLKVWSKLTDVLVMVG